VAVAAVVFIPVAVLALMVAVMVAMIRTDRMVQRTGVVVVAALLRSQVLVSLAGLAAAVL
jgi:hypothetical protein